MIFPRNFPKLPTRERPGVSRPRRIFPRALLLDRQLLERHVLEELLTPVVEHNA